MRWVAYDKRKIRHVTDHDSTGADESVPSDRNPAQDSCIRANGRARTNQGRRECIAGFLNVGSRIRVIGQDAIRTQKNIILDCNPIPDGDSVFHGDIVTKYCAGLDKRVVADIAVSTDPCPFHDVSKSPNSRIRPD